MCLSLSFFVLQQVGWGIRSQVMSLNHKTFGKPICLLIYLLKFFLQRWTTKLHIGQLLHESQAQVLLPSYMNCIETYKAANQNLIRIQILIVSLYNVSVPPISTLPNKKEK